MITLFRYGLIGCTGAAIHLATLVALTEQTPLSPTISSCIGFLITLLLTYPIHQHYTFKGRYQENQWTRYVLVSCSGFLLNALIMSVGTSFDTYHYVTIQFLAMVLIPVSNYILQSRWVFPKNKS